MERGGGEGTPDSGGGSRDRGEVVGANTVHEVGRRHVNAGRLVRGDGCGLGGGGVVGDESDDWGIWKMFID